MTSFACSSFSNALAAAALEAWEAAANADAMTEDEEEAVEALLLLTLFEGTDLDEEVAVDVVGVIVTELLSRTGFFTLGSLGALTLEGVVVW